MKSPFSWIAKKITGRKTKSAHNPQPTSQSESKRQPKRFSHILSEVRPTPRLPSPTPHDLTANNLNNMRARAVSMNRLNSQKLRFMQSSQEEPYSNSSMLQENIETNNASVNEEDEFRTLEPLFQNQILGERNDQLADSPTLQEDKNLPTLPDEIILMICKEVCREGDFRTMHNLLLTNTSIYKEIKNNIIKEFLSSPLAQKIYKEWQIEEIKNKVINKDIKSYLNNIVIQIHDPSLQSLVNSFILKKIKRGNFFKAMELLLANDLSVNRAGYAERDCPVLTRKDIVEIGLCHPEECSDKIFISETLGAHILKNINTFFTQEKDVNVDSAMKIGSQFINEEISCLYRKGQHDLVDLKIESNMFSNIEHEYPVCDAVSDDAEDLLNKLLNAGLDPNRHNKYQESALFRAIRSNKPHLVRLLLEHGADVNRHREYEESALLIAIRSNNPHLVRLLLEHGADVKYEESALLRAISSNNPHLVHLLLEHGADVDGNGKDNYFKKLIRRAEKVGNAEIIKALLDKKTSIASI